MKKYLFEKYEVTRGWDLAWTVLVATTGIFLGHFLLK